MLETEILDDLKSVSDIRESPNCQATLATAVGVYLKSQKDRTDSLDAITLDRSLASFCAGQSQ
jgi:hypothetical protein